MRGTAGHDGYLRPYLRLRLGAALAFLQMGIDPVFLVLLSDHNGLPMAHHGLVVGASQTGMAAGALIAAFVVVKHRDLVMAAGAALLACLATLWADGLLALLLVRLGFGLANGMLYASLIRAATARTPAHAMGTVMLFQLLIATAVALLLPLLAAQMGPGAGPGLALLALALVPLASLALLLAGGEAEPPVARMAAAPVARMAAAPVARMAAAPVARMAAAPLRLDPTTVSAFLIVAASMMIWSYVGAEGVQAGLSGEALGLGVALGSVAAAAAALAVARGIAKGAVVWGALLAGLAMLTPFVAGHAPPGHAFLGRPGVFLTAMILFNVGATWGVARISALAIERREAARSLVPAVQGVAMVMGPLAGALAVDRGGYDLLALLSAATILAAVTALALDGQRRVVALGAASE